VILPSADLHDVWSTHQPVGIECRRCQHRGLVEQTRIGAGQGNTRCVDTLRFRCTQCHRTAVTVHLFHDRRSARRFMQEIR
jgi:hypothetical protein